MKKFFTLFATAVMAMSAYADIVKVEVNPNKESSFAAGALLYEDDALKVTTAYAAGGTSNDYDYFDDQADRTISFAGCVNVRGKRPDESNVIGAVDKSDHTPLILEIKKGMTISGYVRTGDNKKLSLYNQAPFAEVTPNPAAGEHDSREGNDTRWCFTWNVTPGTYTFTEIGGGGRFSGFTYELSEGAEEPEPAEGAIAFNLVTQGNTPETVGTIKSDVEINADEFTITNFLGGSDFSFKIESRDPGNPDVRMYNIAPISGSYELDATTGMTEYYYGLEGLKDKYAVFKLDGNNAIRVMNPYIGKGTFSSVEKLYDNKGYSIEMLIFGTFEKWDATAQDWVAEKYPSAYNISATIPNDDQSGIEDIVVEEFDENAPVEYYNLQGIRVNEPVKGQVVIRRQGSKAIKMVVR